MKHVTNWQFLANVTVSAIANGVLLNGEPYINQTRFMVNSYLLLPPYIIIYSDL